MRLALLGDIHGNHHALEAVLAAAKKHAAERLLITGDFVGYYFWPKEVLELLAPWNVVAVRGNHENMLVEARRSVDFLGKVDGKYGTGLRIAIDQLDLKQLDELCRLPHPLELIIERCRVLLCHGSPWDSDCYIYPDAEQELFERCALHEFDLVVVGHTHYPMFHRVGNTLLINPGSVGQPRNRIQGAQWALFDTETSEVNFFCETYNAGFVIAESRRRHPDLSYLSEVMERR